MGLVWLLKARRKRRPVAFSTPPTSLVRSKRGSYFGSSLDGAASVSSSKVGSTEGLVVSMNAGSAKGSATGSAARGAGGASGIVGSNNPGPSYRLTGATVSRAVRRGTLEVLLPDVRGCLGDVFAAGADFAAGAGVVGLLAGFAAVFDFAIGVIRAPVVGRGALNNRGDRSRRSSKLQPRGNVNREA